MGKTRFAKHTRRFACLPHEPCIYVAELSTGVVKVGSSTSARARMMSLTADVKREHGAQISRFEVFTRPTYKSAFEFETLVVHMLRAVAANVAGHREFFTGITYESALGLVRFAIEAIAQAFRTPAAIPA